LLTAPENEPIRGMVRSPLVKAVCRYVEFADDIRLERTAQVLNYSPEHISRRFHGEMGITYKAYCDATKMQRALHLLDGDASLMQISEQLGYSEVLGFIRAFKRKYGITPHAYRRLKIEHVSDV
jgi:iron complex transport system substrate-binding protein